MLGKGGSGILVGRKRGHLEGQILVVRKSGHLEGQ